MPRRYKRKIEGLDPERGNELLINHEQFDILRELPREQVHIVVCAFADWILGDDEASVCRKVADPAAKLFLRMIIAARKNRVRKYIDFCNKSGPRKKKRANKHKAGQSRLNRLKHIHNTQLLQEEELRSNSSCKSADARKVRLAADAAAFADTAGRRDAPPENPKTSKAILEALGLAE